MECRYIQWHRAFLWVCVSVHSCTMTLEQEHATALLPNSQTKWILSLLSGISVSGRKWGTSGTLWGTPYATAIFCWKKKACLGQTENSVGWIGKTKNGVILSAPEAACFWLWLRMCPPRWSRSLWEEPVGAATAPANLSPDSEPKPVANPVILTVSTYNCSLPRYLQAFRIDEALYTKVLKAGQRACVCGIFGKVG